MPDYSILDLATDEGVSLLAEMLEDDIKHAQGQIDSGDLSAKSAGGKRSAIDRWQRELQLADAATFAFRHGYHPLALDPQEGLESEPVESAVSSKIEQFAVLSRQRLELQDQLGIVTADIRDLEDDVFDEIESSGVARIAIRGITIFTRRNLKAGLVKTRELPDGSHVDIPITEIAQRFADAGLDFLVNPTIHWKRLTAYIKDLSEEEGRALTAEESKERLHEDIRPLVHVEYQRTIAVRRSS